MNNIKKVNIDVYRFIATLMVVSIHIYTLVSFNKDLDYILTRVVFRVAVPFFLMITGYFILEKALSNSKIIKEYSIKILKLYFISILIFLPLNIYNGYFKDIDILVILKDILFNGTFYHLWYFSSLLMGLWILYFLIKKVDNKTLIIIVAFLYIIGLFGDSYFGLVKDIDFINKFYMLIFNIFDYTRNGLFYTPIFLYIGYLFKVNKYKLSNKQNILFILLFVILLTIEGTLLYYFKIPRHTFMYIFLIPLSFFIFSYVINNLGESNKSLRNISSWVYILHPFFIAIYHFVSERIDCFFFDNSLVNYISVVFVTIIFILIIRKVKGVIINGKGIIKR